MKILIDVDGVLRDIHAPLLKLYNEKYNDNKTVNDLIEWDLKKTLPRMVDVWKEFFIPYKNEIFLNAPVYDHVKEVMNYLFKNHEIIIVTSQAKGFEDTTIQWLKNNKIKYDAIVFTKKKNLIEGDIFIDDRIENIKECKYSVKKRIIMNRPWNKSFKNILRVNNMLEFNDIVRYSYG